MGNTKQALVKRLVDKFELEARDDWVGLWEVVASLEKLAADPATLREQSLDVVRALLDRGFVAGNLTSSDPGFRPWRDQRPEAIISRISSEWLALGRIPIIGDIVYFDLPA
jgi:hypothetical protein